MSIVFYHWVRCPECNGSGRVWQHGAHYSTTVTCPYCWGLCQVRARMTKAEVLAAVDKIDQD